MVNSQPAKQPCLPCKSRPNDQSIPCAAICRLLSSSPEFLTGPWQVVELLETIEAKRPGCAWQLRMARQPLLRPVQPLCIPYIPYNAVKMPHSLVEPRARFHTSQLLLNYRLLSS